MLWFLSGISRRFIIFTIGFIFICIIIAITTCSLSGISRWFINCYNRYTFIHIIIYNSSGFSRRCTNLFTGLSFICIIITFITSISSGISRRMTIIRKNNLTHPRLPNRKSRICFLHKEPVRSDPI